MTQAEHEKFESGIHWDEFRIERGDEGGFILYSRDEWQACASADLTADAEGCLRVLGEPTGGVVPAEILEQIA